MSILDDTDFIRVSTHAAESLVDAYYTALNSARAQLESFYVPVTQLPTGRSLPYISYNGQVFSDPAAFKKSFEEMPWTHYEAQSFDVHVMNPSMNAIESKSKKDHERNMSLVVQVSGYVRLHERKEGPLKGFSDSFVLVPNKEEAGGRQTGSSCEGMSITRFL
ncbi:hypothetical protein AMS68_005615 [Peltaster fructicola]|uniref:NTF2 domain-containing protein n=1 Tax=Peltaster fructicola TaxID=286661 RepID=A0A6H0XZS1_9PEZI|nr:hypothetical protein AMS68_005615 [Peltaster fructicola]